MNDAISLGQLNQLRDRLVVGFGVQFELQFKRGQADGRFARNGKGPTKINRANARDRSLFDFYFH